MGPSTSSMTRDYTWETQPDAWQYVVACLDQHCCYSQVLCEFRDQMLLRTGTRMIDWLDYLIVNPSYLDRSLEAHKQVLEKLGFRPHSDPSRWHHPGGIFPELILADRTTFPWPGIGLRVESVERFLQAHSELRPSEVRGQPGDPIRWAFFRDERNSESLSVVERHGVRGFQERPATAAQRRHYLEMEQFFVNRPRPWAHDERSTGFEEARQRFAQVADVLGRAWACDRFFATERAYWQSRNRAARIQFERQNAFGLGWANHDHHTYRSSREHFSKLIHTLEFMGFECRERFYAGGQAGWGAQVLEHPECHLVVFADVDLSPEEVSGDFAHEGLTARAEFGTVGLWCQLHGEAFLSAGLHHLECQFDFDAARQQLEECGVGNMSPFTNFSFLRQAFTEGEIWPIPNERLQELVDRKVITRQDADHFAIQGARGSHLEVLQRDEGYKGFNQTGISDIIQRTHPKAAD